MARRHTLTSEVRAYRPAHFWRALDAWPTDTPAQATGCTFGTEQGAAVVWALRGMMHRWAWECPGCSRLCDVLYVVTRARPLCRRCAQLRYASQYEKVRVPLSGALTDMSARGLIAIMRGMDADDRRSAARRDRWRRYYARHRLAILQRRRVLHPER